VVFTYLDAFGEDLTQLEALRAHDRRGGLGDTHVKRRLDDILQALLAPIRERRVLWRGIPVTSLRIKHKVT
jgi:tryptophanyl-tRNA synthetase